METSLKSGQDQDFQAKNSGVAGFNRKKWVGKEDLSYPIVDP